MPRPRPLSPAQAKATLVAKLTGTKAHPGLGDRLRQLHTKFGARSRHVFLVWTRSSGLERGEGDEAELARTEVLPTPKTTDLTAVALNPFSAGTLPVGSLRVSEVSGTLTRDDLTGYAVPGQTRKLPEMPDVDFFYEVVEDGRGDDPAPRMRFRLAAEPYRAETALSWMLLLERASEDRSRSGQSQLGPDVDP